MHSAASQSHGAGELAARRILVVDDDDIIREAIAQTLSSCGYQAESAEDGATAWDALQLKCYDLLITDNSMPKISGVELIKKVILAEMTLPIILASGTIPEEDLHKFPLTQLAATLPKPFTQDQLLATVKKVLLPIAHGYEGI